MAGKGKKKVEKETRRVIESVSDLVKKKGDRYKFKSKNKKMVKKVKRTCVHWIIRKGKEVPTVANDPERPGYWKCRVCQMSFPIKPARVWEDDDGEKHSEYDDATDRTLEFVNQMQFWSVKLGGDAEDTKMFLKLKECLPRFKKVSRQILKQVNKRQAWEKNREQSDVLARFDSYSGFHYNN